MSNFFTYIGAYVVVIPFAMGATVLSLMWRAWWLYPAWAWFIVPLGVPAIAFWHFAALLLLVDTMKPIGTKKDERKEDWNVLTFVFLWPMLVWVMLRWMR